MSYTKTNWLNELKDALGNIIQIGTKLNATLMNKIEQGIYDAHVQKLAKNGDVLQSYKEKLIDLGTTSGNITLDLSQGCNFAVELNGAAVFAISSPPVANEVASFTLKIKNGSIVYSKTFPTNWHFDGGTIPDMSTPSKDIVITGVSFDAGGEWLTSTFGTRF